MHEANLLSIPIVALVDTNCNPQNVDYVIPSNDDAIRAIKLLVAKVADAILEGKAMRKEEDLDQQDADAQGEKPKSRPSRKPASEGEQDESMGEEVLLGEATLAKLSVSRKVEDVPAAIDAPAPKKVEVKEKKPRARKPKQESAEVAGKTPAETPQAKAE